MADSVVRAYRGWLYQASNGEEDDLVGLEPLPDDTEAEREWTLPFIAQIVADDLEAFGPYVTCRYWTADVALDADTLLEQTVRQALGLGDADYGVAHSEITGYLWTDERLMIGGHDLLEELRSQYGRFLHLECEYHREPPPGGTDGPTH